MKIPHHEIRGGGDSVQESEHLHSHCLLCKRGGAELGVLGGFERRVAHALPREEVGTTPTLCDLCPVDASRALGSDDRPHSLGEVEPEDFSGRGGEPLGRRLWFGLVARDERELVHLPLEQLLEEGDELRPLRELRAGELLAVAVAVGLVGLLHRDEEVSSLRDQGHLPDAEASLGEHLEQSDVVVRVLRVEHVLERSLDLDIRPIVLSLSRRLLISGQVAARDDVLLAVHAESVNGASGLDVDVELGDAIYGLIFHVRVLGRERILILVQTSSRASHGLLGRTERPHEPIFLFDGLYIEEDGDAIDRFHYLPLFSEVFKVLPGRESPVRIAYNLAYFIDFVNIST